MMVRLIAGEFGGRRIDSPTRRSTHVMGERIRGALFNSIASNVQSARVLDAFSGSGAIGLEALSRGAATATFVERDRIAADILAKNITMLGVELRASVIRTSLSNWLETAEPEPFDIVFADPPYHDVQFSTVQRLFSLLKVGGLMVLSHPGRGEVPIQSGIVVVDNRSYGDAHLTFFRRDA